MEHLYFKRYDAFCRWHRVGRGEDVVVYLPGLNIPAVWSFLEMVTLPGFDHTTSVMIDYFGSGDSDVATGFAGTLEAHAEVVAAVIDHLGCGPCTVVGHSMGGSVGIALAIARPDLVKRLVVAEGNLTSGGGEAARKIAAMSVRDFAETGLPEQLAAFRAAAIGGSAAADLLGAAWQRSAPRSLHANARALVDLPDGFAEAYFAMTMPRAFIYGEKSLPASAADATPDAPDPDWLRAQGVSVHVVPGVGHALMRASPSGFAAALRDAGLPVG